VRFVIPGSLTLLAMAAMFDAFTLPAATRTLSSPPTIEMPVVDLTEHGPYDLVFEETKLRGKIVSVRSIVHCLDEIVCLLDLPMMMDSVIYVRIQGISTTLRRQLFQRLQMSNCAQLITGYFTGSDILVTEFSPTSECAPIPRPPSRTQSQLASVGSSPFRCPRNADVALIDAGCISDIDLDAYTYENETRYSQ
jgi:hypothetical protein